MTKQPILDDIEGLLCLYGAAVKAGRERKLSTHYTRVLLAIYYLQQTRLKGVTRKMVAKHTYLWKSVVKAAVKNFVEMGLLEPVQAPRYFLRFTETGLATIWEIEAEYKRQKKVLIDGPVVLNAPRVRL